jgi:hypothetical protein
MKIGEELYQQPPPPAEPAATANWKKVAQATFFLDTFTTCVNL